MLSKCVIIKSLLCPTTLECKIFLFICRACVRCAIRFYCLTQIRKQFRSKKLTIKRLKILQCMSLYSFNVNTKFKRKYLIVCYFSKFFTNDSHRNILYLFIKITIFQIIVDNNEKRPI